jgi:hypothetical protein
VENTHDRELSQHDLAAHAGMTEIAMDVDSQKKRGRDVEILVQKIHTSVINMLASRLLLGTDMKLSDMEPDGVLSIRYQVVTMFKDINPGALQASTSMTTNSPTHANKARPAGGSLNALNMEEVQARDSFVAKYPPYGRCIRVRFSNAADENQTMRLEKSDAQFIRCVNKQGKVYIIIGYNTIDDYYDDFRKFDEAGLTVHEWVVRKKSFNFKQGRVNRKSARGQ